MKKAEVLELLKAAEASLTAAAKRVKEMKKGDQLGAEFAGELHKTIQALQRASRWDGKEEEGKPAGDDETAAGGAARRGRKASSAEEEEE